MPFVDPTEARETATPRSADIRDGLVILERKGAFENTDLSPLNDKAQQRRPVGHDTGKTDKRAAVCRGGWFGLGVPW